MLNVLMAIITVLLLLGFGGNLITGAVFLCNGNHVGVTVCLFIFVLYIGFIAGCIYFYYQDRCDKFEETKKRLNNEISHLNEDREWYEKQLNSYHKLDKFVKEHNEFVLKQSKLEEENKKLKSIILAQNNVKSEDSEQYLKVITENED